MNVDGRRFVLRFSLILSADLHAGHAPIVVAGIFARPIDQQVLLFVHQVLAMILAHLEIRRQLDRIGGARFLAEAAENAAREIDAEELRITPAVLVFRRLKRDAVHRAGDRAQIARDAALAAIRIAREDDAAALPGRQVRLSLPDTEP